jgi:hypothetical protein
LHAQQGHASGPRAVEDEEIWRERKRQHNEEVAIAVERAKQRKEEEEKRYQEQLKQVRLSHTHTNGFTTVLTSRLHYAQEHLCSQKEIHKMCRRLWVVSN